MSRTRFPRFRIGGILLVGIVLVVTAGTGGWALSAVLRPAEDPVEATTHTTAVVEQGEVGESLQLNAIAHWESTPDGINQSAGTVTAVGVSAGQEVAQGTVLYTVNLRPVVAASGETPAFRAMRRGDKGDDVAQLQGMLSALGFYGGYADGKFGAGTESAVKRWQDSLDLDDTGIVELGDVVFVSSLPARITVDADIISRGASLSGGERVLQVLPDAPTFRIPATEAQAGMIPAGTRVEITSPEQDQWHGVAGARWTEEESQTIMISVAAEGDQPVCGEECGQVPAGGETMLTSRIVTTPTVQGLVVPAAAIVTGADGQAAVIGDAGERFSVSVVASAQGMSIIEGDGVTEGMRVRVPGGS